MSIKADIMNKSIVKKLDKVLDNTDCITDLKILIEWHRGEAAMITYEIKEIIVSEEVKNDESREVR